MRRPFLLFIQGLFLASVAAAGAVPAHLPSPAEMTYPRELAELAFGLPGSQPRIHVLQQGNSGHVNFNLSYVDTPLRIGQQDYPDGIGVHAPSDLLVRLQQPAARFRAVVGVDNNPATRERFGDRLVFSVEAGGRELWTSPPLGRDDPAVPVDVALDGGTEFHLKVRLAGGDSRNAHGDWGEARLEYADGGTVRLDALAGHSHLLDRLPLSFVLGGESSRSFLGAWTRTSSAQAGPDRTTHSLCWRKPDGSFEVRCVLVEYHRHPALEWRLFFKNNGSANSPILEQVLPLDAVISRHRSLSKNSAHERQAKVHAFIGSTNTTADFSPQIMEVQRAAPVRLATGFGRPSELQLPFWNFDYGGYGFITALGWSGDWQAEVRRLSSMHTGMQAGMANLRLYLMPGEEISSPSVCLLFWEGAEPLRGHNLFRRYMRDCVTPVWGNGQAPEVHAMSGGSSALETVSERNQLDFIRKIAGTGADTYWLDAGWYQGPPGGHWSKGRGNWFPDKAKFPRGLRPLADEAHRLGLKFLLWFEPELVQPGTELDLQNPEWLLHKKKGRYALFNLGNPAACRFLTDMIAARLKEWDVDIFRNDFNVDPREFWRQADPPDRTGITELRYVEGFHRFWDGLRAARPGLLIDNCASGGRRIDYETCKRSVPLWRSDYLCGPESGDVIKADYYEASQNHTGGLSHFLPYHGTGQGVTFDRYRDRSLAATSTMLSIGAPAPDALADVPQDKLKKAWADLRAYVPLMAYDYYPLTDFSLTDLVWMAWQYDHPEAGEGCLIVFRRRHTPYVAAEFSLRAIDPQARYRLTFLNTGEQQIVSGAALAHLPVALAPRESTVVRYTKLAP